MSSGVKTRMIRRVYTTTHYHTLPHTTTHYHTLPQSHLQRDDSDWGAATWKVAARKPANISRRFVDCE